LICSVVAGRVADGTSFAHARGWIDARGVARARDNIWRCGVAEIRIQRKRRRAVWPWLLGLLALVVLPMPFLFNRDEAPLARDRTASRDTLAARDTAPRPDTAPRLDTAARVTAAAAGAVAPAAGKPPAADAAPPAATTAPGTASFERFIARRRPAVDGQAQRQYTAGGLRRLADELRALGASEAGVTAIRTHADSLQMPSVRGDAHADHARAAFLVTVRELDLLRDRYAAQVDTARLRSNAWAITPGRSLIAQRGQVQAFFESVRDALRVLPRRR
jgi:hypothetical protein